MQKKPNTAKRIDKKALKDNRARSLAPRATPANITVTNSINALVAVLTDNPGNINYGMPAQEATFPAFLLSIL